jgi:Predicted periplasmic or secreted lipoprotein
MKSNNHRFLNATLAGMLGTLAAASAMAAPAMPTFKAADSNGDGMVSMVEYAAQGGQAQAFREGDTNDDSRLTSDEYAKAVANQDRIKAGKFIDDAWITAKVKALLLKDEGIKGLAVQVDTHQGTVQLSGWVNSPEQITQAEKIARSVEGVKGVRNDLLVKG